MQKLCADCNVCSFMPEQTKPRLLSHEMNSYPILVIDDATTEKERIEGAALGQKLLGDNLFNYTTTIRCQVEEDFLSQEELEIATLRCSVWTHLVSQEKSLILSTERGMKQLSIETCKGPGHLFKSNKYGVVLCIPPLVKENARELLVELKPKVERALKEIGL